MPGRLLSGTVLLGAAGSLAVAVGGFGAGGIPRDGPLIGDGPLAWLRYGHGQDLADILLYTGLGLLVWAWIRLGREVLAGTAGARHVLTAATVWLVPVLFCPPLFTRDVYSYLGQGALLLHGYDPYAVGPVALPPAPIVPNVHEMWQATPAPYGPLFILISAGVYWITGGNVLAGVLGMRLVLLAGFGLLACALPRLAGQLGGSVAVAFWLVLANPMMVVHLVGGPHNDLLMVGLLAAGTVFVLARRHAAGIAVVTVAMAIKPTAAVALPFLVWVWAARLPGTRARQLLRAGSASVAVFGVVFAGLTLAAGLDLGWVTALIAPMHVVNWLSPPSGAGQLLHAVVSQFVDVGSAPFVGTTRVLGAVALAIIAGVQWWRARDGGPDAVRRCAFVLFCVAMLAPPTLPWYLSWGLVLAAGLAWSPRGLAVVAGASAWLLAYYFPSGEQAQYAPAYIAGLTAVAVVAGVSLLRPDPLRLRRRPPAAGHTATAPAPEPATTGDRA